MTIATSGQHFLEFTYENRVNIYRQLGVIFSRPIYGVDLKGHCIGENSDLVPLCIPEKKLFDISKEVSADALSVFWSKNKFRLRGKDLGELLRLGSPLMWSSLRDLTVSLELAPLVESNIDSGAEAKNDEHFDYWREVCVHLGAHLPPSQLTLHVNISNCQFNFNVGMPNCNRDHLVASVKNACSSMLELPVLKNVSFASSVSNSLGLQQIVTHLANRLTYTRLPTERKNRPPFRFMDLPAEIQHMILEYADLVAPGPVIPTASKGYVLDDCYARRCKLRSHAYETYQAICYDSSRIYCWSLPADLFLVNRHISAMSAQIFFSRNEFVVGLGHRFTGRAPKGLIWGLTQTGHDPSPLGLQYYPQSSQFLWTFPPECIRTLRFLTWCFPMRGGLVILGKELKADWIRAVDFIAQNVKPLSRLTITLDMCYTRIVYSDDSDSDDYEDDDPIPTESRNKVLLPLQRLWAAGLRDLFVHLSRDRTLREHAAEELRLERLAMGEGYHPTKEELGSRIS
ncbi:hypothetical protein V8E54_007409 [Elaphomyces granulatus]